MAIPLQEFVAPLAAVLTVNAPVNPASVAVKLCAAPAPVATNESPEGVRPIALAGGVGEGAADGVAVGAGVAVGVGGETVLPVTPDPLQPTMSTAKKHTEKPRHRRIAVQPLDDRGAFATVSLGGGAEHTGYPYLLAGETAIGAPVRPHESTV